MTYKPGDTVYLLIAYQSSYTPVILPIGTTGKIVCRWRDAIRWVVEFEGYTGGHNGNMSKFDGLSINNRLVLRDDLISLTPPPDTYDI